MRPPTTRQQIGLSLVCHCAHFITVLDQICVFVLSHSICFQAALILARSGNPAIAATNDSLHEVAIALNHAKEQSAVAPFFTMLSSKASRVS